MQPSWKKKILLPAALALGVSVASVGSSACFTSSVVQSSNAKEVVVQAPSLRVEHTYYDSRGRLLVLAEGGPWQSDPTATPHASIWFVLDFRQKADPSSPRDPEAQAQVITFPQSIIKQGAPDLAKLAADGFVEIPFNDFGNGRRRSLQESPADSYPLAQIIYLRGTKVTPNFPEQIGSSPQFNMETTRGSYGMPAEIADISLETHHSQLLLLPVSAAADAATAPLWIVFALGGGLK